MASRKQIISYDRIYNLAERLGFESAEKAWNENPIVESSTEPTDYRVVPKSEMKMTKKQSERHERFLPNGEPRFLRIYDNGGSGVEGGTIDRYSVLFTGRYTQRTGGEHILIGMNEYPFSPQGFCQHMSYPYQCDTLVGGKPSGRWGGVAIGRSCHLGKRIAFSELPADCQRVVLRDYCELWDLNVPETEPPSITVESE